MNIFYGEEVEGPSKKTPTLFFSGKEITEDNVRKSLLLYPSCFRLYFGANNIRVIPNLKVNFWRWLIKHGYNIIQEVTLLSIQDIQRIPMDLRKKIEFIMVIDVNSISIYKEIKAIKFVDTESLLYGKINKYIRTNLNDKGYSKDKEILL